MKRNIKNNNKGFTIIEVLIVLVIAGLIMLIVFLAVPALQRNSRNTQRKSEAARVISAASEWRTNNSNAWPATCFPILATCSGAPNDVRNAIIGNAGTLNTYSGATFNILENTTGQAGNLATSSLGSTVVANNALLIMLGNAKCDNNDLQPGSGFVAVFAVETGGASTATCVAS
ncbi:type II secretion system protein [Candidatus Saccharibacteria bacterium]|nr:type II secretion system protein [Candidatus Saccharibacteria bacterium]